MKEILCKVLGLREEQISIKAKTNEQLDAVGEGRAIKAQVVTLLRKI
jgi:2-C-methyl-D-erythritol 2,4-cyclodiphosphate synthase